MAQEVVVIEDDRAVAGSIAQTLRQLGYACRQYYDGETALQGIASSTPDLVLVDLLLPRKDGFGVMAELRSSDATRELPIVAISGVYRGRDQESVVRDAGGRAFLEKPFEVAQLERVVRELIGRARSAVQAEKSQHLDLSEISPAEVIWQAMADEFTGALHFRLRKRHKIVLFSSGRATAVRSNLAREALGRRLCDAGRIDERTVAESLRRAKATGKPQGQILVELGAITAPEVEKALSEQGSDKLLELFSWTAGEVWRQPHVEELNLSSELAGWTPERIILRGVERLAASAMRRVLDPYRDQVVVRSALAVDSSEGRLGQAALLRALDSASPLVGALIDDHLPALYALWRIGVLAFQPAAAPEAEPSQLSAPDSGASVSGGAASEAAPADDPRVALLQSQLQEQSGKSHYEVLGVARDAAPAALRKAFFQAAKSCHPDRLGDASAQARELAARAFGRISEAHDALSDPAQRSEYDHQLERGSSPVADPAAVARIMSAEQQFQEAEALLRQKRYAQAVATVEQALELDPEEGEFHALLGWATLMRDPEAAPAREQASQILEKAIAIAPQSPSGYYYMAKLHKICDRVSEAERMFRRVLELRPRHVEANQEIRLIERRRNSESSSRGLFGRKGKN